MIEDPAGNYFRHGDDQYRRAVAAALASRAIDTGLVPELCEECHEPFLIEPKDLACCRQQKALRATSPDAMSPRAGAVLCSLCYWLAWGVAIARKRLTHDVGLKHEQRQRNRLKQGGGAIQIDPRAGEKVRESMDRYSLVDPLRDKQDERYPRLVYDEASDMDAPGFVEWLTKNIIPAGVVRCSTPNQVPEYPSIVDDVCGLPPGENARRYNAWLRARGLVL